MKFVKLSCDNVQLCAIDSSEEAISKYTKWMNDANIDFWINKNYKIMTYEQEEKWCKSRDDYSFNIVVDDELVGNCSITLDERNINADLGICIGEPIGRDKGIGTKVIKMLTKYAFNELRVHRCSIRLNGDNIRAYKCYTKCGYTECGREHEKMFYHGHYADEVYLELLEDTYKSLVDLYVLT